MPLLHKVEIWTGVTDALRTFSLTNWQTLKDRATQLLLKYKSGALVTQYIFVLFHCHLYSFYLIVACLLGPQHLFQVDNPRPPNPCPLGRPHPLSEHPQNILTNLSLRELITLECAPTKSPTFFSQVLQVH